MTEMIRQNYRSEIFIKGAMDRWGSAVFKLAFAQTASKADAEDVYQEVFIRLFKDKSFFNDDEHLKAWLLRVTINCCRDLARLKYNRKITNIDDLKEQAAQSSTTTLEVEHDLTRALEALPENMRAAIHLYYYEGYSSEDIARIMDTESSTIRSRLQRAREQLKTLLGGASYGTYE